MSDKSKGDSAEQHLGDLPSRRDVAAGAPVALVVEDDPDSLRIAGTMLAHLGYGVRAASTPDEAMHALMEDAPALLVVDLCLPVMDGISLVKLVRRMRDLCGVPMVAVSGIYDHSGRVGKALAEQGVYSFLAKPYTVGSLREAVDFARATALRQGPPPPCTMKAGGLFDKEDAEQLRDRKAREATGRTRGAPKALPASQKFEQSAHRQEEQRRNATPAAPARVFRPSAAEPMLAASPTGGTARPPTQPRPSVTRTPPPRAPVAAAERGFTTLDQNGNQQVDYDPELTAVMTLGTSESPVEVEGCESSQLLLHTDNLQPDDGDTVRIELRFRCLQQDAMRRRRVRVVGTLGDVEGRDAGWRCRLSITAAQPVEHYYELCAILGRNRPV